MKNDDTPIPTRIIYNQSFEQNKWVFGPETQSNWLS